MKKISLKEFGAQWVTPKSSRTVASRLAFDAEEFTTLAGEYAADCFRQSFVEGGFYGYTRKWEPRTSAWGKRFKHPLMVDQGVLMNAIKGEKGKGLHYGVLGQRDFTRRYRYDIGTEESSTAVEKKRGESSNIGYAAVHNSDPRLTNYTVNQYSSRKPVQRQFMGHSELMLHYIEEELLPHVFDGFPR